LYRKNYVKKNSKYKWMMTWLFFQVKLANLQLIHVNYYIQRRKREWKYYKTETEQEPFRTFFQRGETYDLIFDIFQIVKHMTAVGWFFPFIPIFIFNNFFYFHRFRWFLNNCSTYLQLYCIIYYNEYVYIYIYISMKYLIGNFLFSHLRTTIIDTR